MAGTISPIYDSEKARLDRMMLTADALRKQGMSQDIGQGYQGGRVYIVGNPLANVAASLGGALLGNKAQAGLEELERGQEQARQDWMAQMPAAESMQPVEQFGPAVPGEQMPSTPTMLPKSAKQYGQEMTKWATTAPRGMEAFQQAGLVKAMNAPFEEQARLDKIAAQEHETNMKLADRREQRDWQEGQNKLFRLTAQQQAEQADKRLAAMLARATGAGKGGDEVNQDAADFIAARFLEGDQNALVGISRNKGLHGAVMASIARQAKEQNIDAKEAVQRGLEFGSERAAQRKIGERGANIEMAANEAANMIPIVSDLSKKVSRTDFPTINAAGNIIRKQTGDPNITAFDQSIDTFINAYARAISPSGVPTVADKKRAHEKLNAGFSQGQLDATIGVMKQEMDAAIKSPGQASKARREARVGGEASKPAEKTVVREVQLKDGRIGVEYSDGSRGYK